MRIIFFILILTSFSLKAQKSSKDVIDFNKFDTTLFYNCFLELCNEKRLDVDKKKVLSSEDGSNAAKFHALYVAETGLFEHNQKQSYKGLNLRTPKERINYFSKGKKYASVGEILSKNIISKAITYIFLTKQVFKMYSMSKSHNEIMMEDFNFVSLGISISKEQGKINFYTCFLFLK